MKVYKWYRSLDYWEAKRIEAMFSAKDRYKYIARVDVQTECIYDDKWQDDVTQSLMTEDHPRLIYSCSRVCIRK